MSEAGLPWVVSTPQARVQRRVEEIKQERPLVPPPPPINAPPIAPTVVPKTTLSLEDQQLLTNLKQLQSQIALPEELASKLAELEQQQKQHAPVISHGQVNRLAKLRTQLSSIADKIKAADQDWQLFMGGVLDRVHNHVTAYQTHRQGLLDSFHTKQTELTELKQMIQQASLNLTHPEALNHVPTEAPDLSGPIQELQRLSKPLSVPTVNLEEGSEEEAATVDDAEMSDKDRVGSNESAVQAYFVSDLSQSTETCGQGRTQGQGEGQAGQACQAREDRGWNLLMAVNELDAFCDAHQVQQPHLQNRRVRFESEVSVHVVGEDNKHSQLEAQLEHGTLLPPTALALPWTVCYS